MAKTAKARHSSGRHSYPDVKCSIPTKEVADKLTNLYLRTFESAYRILHIPSFQKEYDRYWNHPEDASPSLELKVLLVMAIGTCFYRSPHDEADLRCLAVQWVHAAQSWLRWPLQKDCLSISGLQIQCLLLLASQIHSVQTDLIWISAGTLLRTAMHMGLHRDPRHFPQMSILQAEIRRRLWATVLEIAVQSALDSAIQPLISCDDFDTDPPSNIDDNQIDETTKYFQPRPRGVFTETSTQTTLLSSLRTRIEVVRLINDFRSEASYEDVLRLGLEMANALRESSSPHMVQAPTSTAFQRNLLDYLIRRFLLALHRPFAGKAMTDPRFYFSRKVALESALTILSPAEDDEDYVRLMIIGDSLIQGLGHSALAVGLELISQIDEDRTNRAVQRNQAYRDSVKDALKKMNLLWEKSVRIWDNNVKGHLFFSMVIGQIEAMESGGSLEEGIANAARSSLSHCLDLLQARIQPDGPDSSHNDKDFEGSEGAPIAGLGLQDLEFPFDMLSPWLFQPYNEDFQM